MGILNHLYKQKLCIDIPWDFRKEMDVRTIVALNPRIKKDHKWMGTLHDPLDDCTNQIVYLCNTLQHFGLNNHM